MLSADLQICQCLFQSLDCGWVTAPPSLWILLILCTWFVDWVVPEPTFSQNGAFALSVIQEALGSFTPPSPGFAPGPKASARYTTFTCFESGVRTSNVTHFYCVNGNPEVGKSYLTLSVRPPDSAQHTLPNTDLSPTLALSKELLAITALLWATIEFRVMSAPWCFLFF